MDDNAQTAPVAPTKAEKIELVKNKVFGTTELLEGILLHVGDDYKTLLLSQRVSKVFHATIEESGPLQHALFFKIHADTHPAVPPILRDRKIKISADGASVTLGYRYVNRTRPTTYVASTALSDSEALERRREVDLRLEVKRSPGGGGPRTVDIGGSWQKIILRTLQKTVFCDRLREYGPAAFTVALQNGEATLGQVVDEALRDYVKSKDFGPRWNGLSLFGGLC